MIIDLDSHLREGYFADQVYKLAPPFEEYTPICIKEGEPHERRFKTKFERRRGSGEGNSSAYNHSYMYDPKENWKGGDIARRQVVGYDMAKRLEGNALESLDKQVLFPTGISLPVATDGPLGAALCRAYNNWAANLVKGYEDALLPVAMLPAGYPQEMPNELRRAVKELGFKCAHLVCYQGEKNLDHPDFFPYYATDYPHFDSEYPHTVSKLKANNFLTPIQKERILGANAQELLKI